MKNKLLLLFLTTRITYVLLEPSINDDRDEDGFFIIRPTKESSGIYKKAAVATNAKQCAKIGAKMLRKGGSAVDSAIATLLCDGIHNPQSMGIGGGFFMTIWDASGKQAHFLDAREYAPSAASERLFTEKNETKFVNGGKAIAIPGEIAGYWAAHKKFGKLPWATLFEDSIKICEQDLRVTKYMANVLSKINVQELHNFPALKQILVAKKDPSRFVGLNETIPARLKLSETLKKIRDHGADIFYKGEIAKNLIADIEKVGGIITLNDLKNYEVQWKTPVSSKIGNVTMLSAPNPGSGAVLAFILNILKKIVPTAPNKYVLWHRVVETLKWGFAKRNEIGDFIERLEYVNKSTNEDCLVKASSKVKIYDNSYSFIEKENKTWDKDCLIAVTVKQLLDESYADTIISLIEDNKTFNDYKHYNITRKDKIDRGTAHTSVFAPDGSAVAVTSTINTYFGSCVVSESTGIILNNEMDDYSYPGIVNKFDLEPSEFNFLRKGSKLRPQSSMAPTIMLDDNQSVRLVVGAAGGSKIISGIVQTIFLDLLMGKDIKTSIEYPRIHYNLWPMYVEAENSFDPEVLNYLKEIGHNIKKMGLKDTVSAIDVSPQNVFACADYRRQGGTCGF